MTPIPQEAAPPPGFREFVLGRSAALHRTAVLLTHDQHTAQDLVQDALARAWQTWHRIEGRPEAYVRQIMMRRFLTDRRRRWHGERATEHLPESPVHERTGAGPQDPAEQASLTLPLIEAVATLPPRQRAVVVLRYYHDYTEAQTARTLGIAVGTVKSQHSKALASLRLSDHLDAHQPVGTTGPRGTEGGERS